MQKKIHIIVPMSGVGQRFLDAGYTAPKPLIPVDGRPMIAHVIGLFPGDVRLTFICNTDHLQQTPMRKILETYAPHGTIVGIAPHKLGPVFAVSQVFDLIDDTEETIVTYCDFSKDWDFHGFLRDIHIHKAAGALSVYRGFHPHMLGHTQYAFCRSQGQWLLEIREKQPFTDNRLEEYASDGTYYFATGALLKQYCAALLLENKPINGEFYMSMVYNLMIADNLPVLLHEILHMLQWGTPEDLRDYDAWSDRFRTLSAPVFRPHLDNAITVMPMAGEGVRFRREGFAVPKPWIPVSGKPMVIQALSSLPMTHDVRLVCQQNNFPSMEKQLLAEGVWGQQSPEKNNLFAVGEQGKGFLKGDRPLKIPFRWEAITGITPILLDAPTEGQAITVCHALQAEDADRPLVIGACDTGICYTQAAWEAAFHGTPDVVVFSAPGYLPALRHPDMYGWLAVENGCVKKVSVKTPVSTTPHKDHVITGVFYFKSAGLFTKACQRLQLQNRRINGEFYVDSIVQLLCEEGLKIAALPVSASLCWGTPDEWRSFGYWQQYFDRCSHHPYALDKDPFVPAHAVSELRKSPYYTFYPGSYHV